MKIQRITAYPDRIELVADLSLPTSAVGQVCVPLTRVGTGRHTPSRLLCESARTEGERLVFPRFADGYDLLLARFTVTAEGKEADGVCYVTDTAPAASRGNTPRPPVGKPVGTWVTCPGEDMDYLGLGGMMTEINMAWIMTLTPAEGDIPHEWNRKTYYFVKSMMDTYDRLMMPCMERGLHLGLRYEEGYADDQHLFIHPGPYKRICAAIRAMDTEKEDAWIDEARAYVGEALFDLLLDPPLAENSTPFSRLVG